MILDKDLDKLELIADALINEGPIAYRLIRVCQVGLTYKKLIDEIRRLKKQDGSLSIVPKIKIDI